MALVRPIGRLSRIVLFLVSLAVAVAGLSLALSMGGSPQPAPDATRSPGGTAQPPQAGSKVAEEPALVDRILADLRAGRRPEQEDRPLAGAPVKVIQASPDKRIAIASLTIPAIGLRTPIFEGVTPEILEGGPGHWPGTPGPGEPGNSVLSGHRTTETKPFYYLDRLTRGDRITIRQGQATYDYAVVETTIVPESRYVPFVLQQPKKPRAETVTLFACNPIGQRYERIVVRARALGGGRSS